jgi:hypothetical protein
MVRFRFEKTLQKNDFYNNETFILPATGFWSAGSFINKLHGYRENQRSS